MNWSGNPSWGPHVATWHYCWDASLWSWCNIHHCTHRSTIVRNTLRWIKQPKLLADEDCSAMSNCRFYELKLLGILQNNRFSCPDTKKCCVFPVDTQIIAILQNWCQRFLIFKSIKKAVFAGTFLRIEALRKMKPQILISCLSCCWFCQEEIWILWSWGGPRGRSPWSTWQPCRGLWKCIGC